LSVWDGRLQTTRGNAYFCYVCWLQVMLKDVQADSRPEAEQVAQ
jgi:hypothetical protein